MPLRISKVLKMTGKEITERAARIAYPDLPQEAIERIAVAIWNASPSGDLVRIEALEFALSPPTCPLLVTKLVKSLRNVEAVAAEWRHSESPGS